MPWNLAVDNNIRLLPIPEQLFAFAYAYLDAAETLCQKTIERAEERDWPSGAVVLMNAAHAVELFIKAALLRHDKSIDVWSFGHDVAALAKAYNTHFPEPELAWDIPFATPQPDGLTSEEQRLVKKLIAHPSIELRYPVTKEGMPWLTLHGYEPHSFAKDLERIRADFDRICHGQA